MFGLFAFLLLPPPLAISVYFHLSFSFSHSFWLCLPFPFFRRHFPFDSACSQLNRNWFVWLALVAHTHTHIHIQLGSVCVCVRVWVFSLVFHVATFVNIKWAFSFDCDSIKTSANNLLIFIKKCSAPSVGNVSGYPIIYKIISGFKTERNFGWKCVKCWRFS